MDTLPPLAFPLLRTPSPTRCPAHGLLDLHATSEGKTLGQRQSIWPSCVLGVPPLEGWRNEGLVGGSESLCSRCFLRHFCCSESTLPCPWGGARGGGNGDISTALGDVAEGSLRGRPLRDSQSLGQFVLSAVTWLSQPCHTAPFSQPAHVTSVHGKGLLSA